MRTTRVGVLAIIAVGTVGLATVGMSPASAQGGGRHDLHGSRPAWQTNPKFQKTGTVATSKKVTAKVWLGANNSSDLAALAQSVSDPTSASYGKYLTHDQYVAQFAPTQAQVAQVKSWLTSDGLSVTSVGSDNHYVAVSGTAAEVSKAFGTTMSTYKFDGGTVQAPDSTLSVPNSVTTPVLAITGLTPAGHTVQPQSQPQDLGAPAGFVNATPCSSYYGQKDATTLPKFQGKTLPYAVCGYTPKQLRGTYGVGNKQDGSGQTVAIVDAFDSSTLAADASTYATRHGDPALRRGQFSDLSFPEGASTASPDPIGDCGGNGWYGEQALDVEAVHGMATGANIQYVGAASCFDDDLLASLSKIVSINKASLISNSWGEPTVIANDPADGCTTDTPCLTLDQSTIDAYQSIFQQGAVQGIGFYFSSGDDGDELANAGYIHPDYPAGDPWVTAVGGTALGVTKANTRQFETGWGTNKYSLTADGKSWDPTTKTWLYGAGGGFSQLFDQPFYQRGVVRNNPTGGRAVPDIAMDADPTTGMLIGETQDFALPSVFGPAGVHYGEYRVGGTSLASPLLAGVQAVAQQRAHGRLGFANPLIYSLAKTTSSFYDPASKGPDAGNIRSDYTNGYNNADGFLYTVRTFDQDSSLNVNRGWDDVTGVGTVTGTYLDKVARRY
ncbi:S53 family peptidase [Nocardioides sp. Iso805N]|uniref:S53 family peptidase n=1 Tax=Nocardioides sp. Iso805N TaxID=1283287 RepID=UPI00037AEF95|nr:S53 family peptidase [Nocardioides sp. Iso805N]